MTIGKDPDESMDVRHINAFLEATKNVFDTMLKIPVTFDKPVLNSAPQTHDVSGVIGLSGDVVGVVVIGFGEQTAVRIVCAFAGTRHEFGTPDFEDAIGELTNMIVGSAKSKLEGLSVSIGCPSVISSPDHHVSRPSDAASICIPCDTPGGGFVIDVTFRPGSQALSSENATEEDSKAISSAESAA